MTPTQSAEKGYKVIAASPFEVGLTKNGKGIRTWWAADFGGKLPSLSHPEIVKAIERVENAKLTDRPEKTMTQDSKTDAQTETAQAGSVQRIVSCPFCGNEWCSIRNAGNNGVLRQVYCRDVDCGARGPARPSEDHAIAAWNNRAAND